MGGSRVSDGLVRAPLLLVLVAPPENVEDPVEDAAALGRLLLSSSSSSSLLRGVVLLSSLPGPAAEAPVAAVAAVRTVAAVRAVSDPLAELLLLRPDCCLTMRRSVFSRAAFSVALATARLWRRASFAAGSTSFRETFWFRWWLLNPPAWSASSSTSAACAVACSVAGCSMRHGLHLGDARGVARRRRPPPA